MITVSSINGRSVRNTLELFCTDKDTFPTNATGGVNGYRIDNGSVLQVLDTNGGGLKIYAFSEDEDNWYEM